MRKIETWNYELQFCEDHTDLLLSYLRERWKSESNEQVFKFIIDWSLPLGWHFIEALHSYFTNNFPTNREFFAAQIIKKHNDTDNKS